MVVLLLFIVVVLVSSVVGYKTARISLRTNDYKNRIGIDSYVSNRINRRTYSRASSIYSSNSDETLKNEDVQSIRKKIDTEFVTVALPAFIGLVAEPLIAIVDASYVGKLGAVYQAGMGIAISAQYSVAKLYNDPLLKTSTSLVAGKKGEELSASVATAISTALLIGILQFFLYRFYAGSILSFMGVSALSDMRSSSLSYLKWRSLGVPAATVLLVSNSIFRGRGDTKTPLLCTTLGHIVNILLDPFLIFGCGMGVAGAGLANALANWVAAMPLLYLLNKSIPFIAVRRIENKLSLLSAVESYYKAGGLVLLRTIAKTSAYTVTSAAAAKLGSITMAAYSLTFNLGFATSQLCESILIAAQALLARDMPLETNRKKVAAAHVITRAIQAGVVISSLLSIITIINKEKVISSMTSSLAVRQMAAQAMPIVLVAQIFKCLSSSTGGILLGGLDWNWSTASMSIAALLCVGLTKVLPGSLTSIWIALATFMATQLVVATYRIFSNKGPWKGLTFVYKKK